VIGVKLKGELVVLESPIEVAERPFVLPRDLVMQAGSAMHVGLLLELRATRIDQSARAVDAKLCRLAGGQGIGGSLSRSDEVQSRRRGIEQ
jgi:hypothetical protein